MDLKKIFIIGVLFHFSTSCVSTYKSEIVTENKSHTFNKTDSFFVVKTDNGAYGEKTYEGSGEMTAKAATLELSRNFSKVLMSQKNLDYNEALKKAENEKYTYMVFPQILHWEDRATEWSGIPDKVSIKISVVQVALKKIISSVVIDGKSKWASFGGDHPQDLLSEPFREYFNNLIQFKQ